METERIALSQTERDRLCVLHEIRQKHITQSQAARRLKISDRHIRRLLVGVGQRGDRALLHGLRGRPSNRRLATRLERKILRRVRQRYADFGPALAAEHLAQEGLPVSRETLRKWSAGGSRATTARTRYDSAVGICACAIASNHAARGESLRPTASRTHHQCTFKSLQKCSSQPPMADISTLRCHLSRRALVRGGSSV